MSHEIWGERLLLRGKPAWHGLGRVFDEGLKLGAAEAIVGAGLDYRVHKLPLYVSIPAGATTMVPDRFALMREPHADDPNWAFFGVAGSDYTMIQNVELGEMLDPLTERWPVETVGALKSGRTIFMALDAGGASVAGDEIHKYFLITDTKDGGRSVRILFSPVRVVCWNTLSTAIRAGSAHARIPHTTSVKDDVNLYLRVMVQLQKTEQKVMSQFEAMAAAKLTPSTIDGVFEFAYPLPKRPMKMELGEELGLIDVTGEFQQLADEELDEDLKATVNSAVATHQYYSQRIAAYRGAAHESLDRFNQSTPSLANTGWATYNSVVEVEDYRKGKSDESAITSALFGGRSITKARAFDAALRASR